MLDHDRHLQHILSDTKGSRITRLHKIRKIVLAYSGGLDTSVILKWLQQEYEAEVVTFTADLGQGEELDAARRKAELLGIREVYVEDLREEFVSDFVFPMFRANTVYEGKYLLGTSIARPLIAKRLVEIAHETGADAIAHGATGKGNDQVRFELSAYALNPGIRVIAPWRKWTLGSRAKLVEFARLNQIPVARDSLGEAPFSVDANLLHVSSEGKILEDPAVEAPAHVYQRTNSPEDAPDKPQRLKIEFKAGDTVAVDGEKLSPADRNRAVEAPAHVYQRTNSPEDAPDKPQRLKIEFKAGDPVAVDGENLSPARLLARLNEVGGRHGVGRLDLVENRFVGLKSRGIYETPGGTILLEAHRGIEQITLDGGSAHLKDELMPKYAELIYNGFWYSPERLMLQALIDESQRMVSGSVTVKLYKGSARVVGRESKHSLYSEQHVTFEDDAGAYDQEDAEGFIKLNALRLRLLGMRRPLGQ